MSKVLHGLDQFHLAVLTNDSRDGVEYDTPIPVPGAVNVSVQPNTDSTTFFADNGSYAVLNSLGDIDVDMEVADLPLEIQKTIFGHTEEDGVQFASTEDRAAQLALGFRARISTGGYRYYWLLKGQPELLPIEHQTDESTSTPQTATLTMKFMPLQFNRRWKAQADSETFAGNDWFEEVIYTEGQVTGG